MESWKLEQYLRNSPMDYSLKATRYLCGIAQTPCPNCPFKNENPPVPLIEKTAKCFQRCEFKIIIWILNPEQLSLYEKMRPPEKKKEDIEAAINLGKITQIENKIKESRGIEISSPSFLNFIRICFHFTTNQFPRENCPF